jgi:uncharacterized protein
MPEHAPTPPPFVGRATEWAELEHARDSGRPELIAVYGRRRVGKTYLVRRFFAAELRFELTGTRNATHKQQLVNFAEALSARSGIRYAPPRDWPEAFQTLGRYLEEFPTNTRQAVFFDELPWLAARRSSFLSAFEYFWNTWGTRRSNLIVVICGSAASWMIAKVLRDRGGLHNRVTRRMQLHPFSLHETEMFLSSRGIQLDRRQILELTMAVGGIPYYLDYVRKGRSAAQNIDAMFFARQAPLHDEFENLYAALFEHHERHLKVIRALGRKQSGLTRNEIIHASKIPGGGNISTILGELESSDFICKLQPFGRVKREPVYRLIDEFTLFHLRWVESGREPLHGIGQWMHLHSTPAWQAWSGYAFENLCLRHVPQIKHALSIGGVRAGISAWRHQSAGVDDTGAQIDLLIDRQDGVINVCEMKFSTNEFTIDKKYARELREKLTTFRRVMETKKATFLTMVTTHGIKPNELSAELVQSSVKADALFAA